MMGKSRVSLQWKEVTAFNRVYPCFANTTTWAFGFLLWHILAAHHGIKNTCINKLRRSYFTIAIEKI